MPSNVGLEKRISNKIVFAVEGNDALEFLRALIRHCKLDDSQVYFENCGGTSEFHDKIDSLFNDVITPGTIKVFACFRDRENDPDPFASLQGSYRKAGIPVPVTVHEEMSSRGAQRRSNLINKMRLLRAQYYENQGALSQWLILVNGYILFAFRPRA